MIPDKTRKEWYDLVTGKSNHIFTNFVLQLQVNKAKREVSNGEKQPDEAVEELYILCNKYQKAVKRDMDAIFNTNSVIQNTDSI